MGFREIFCMVPKVHLRTVEDVFKFAQRDFDIRMSQLTRHQGENMDNKKVGNPKPDHRQRYIFEGAIKNIFHPMVAQ